MNMLASGLIYMSLISSTPSKEAKELQNKGSFLCEILDNTKKLEESIKNRSSPVNSTAAEKSEDALQEADSGSGVESTSRKVTTESSILNLSFHDQVTHTLRDARYYVQLALYFDDYQIIVKRRGTNETVAIAKTPQKTFAKLSLGVGRPEVTINCPPLSTFK